MPGSNERKREKSVGRGLCDLCCIFVCVCVCVVFGGMNRPLSILCFLLLSSSVLFSFSLSLSSPLVGFGIVSLI